MAKRSKTPTFILDYLEIFRKQDKDICAKIIRIARNIYNFFLREYLKRYEAYESDEEVIELKKQYKSLKDQENKLDEKEKKKYKKEHEAEYDYCKLEFERLQKKHGWSEKAKYSDGNLRLIQSHYWSGCLTEKQLSHYQKGAASPVGSGIVMTLNDRAYKTVVKHAENMRQYKRDMARWIDGKLKEEPKQPKVHFARKNKDFSVEGVTNEDSIYFREPYLIFNRNKKVETKVYRKDTTYYDMAMQNRIKFCRLCERTIRGKKRYFVQLAMEGIPPQPKQKVYGTEKIDILDIKIARMYMEKGGTKKEIELAPGCKNPEEKIAELDRKMDASRRVSNPENFNEDGTCKKGPLKWNDSKNYLKLKARRAEIYRSMQVRRKISHECLVNEMLAEGTDITIKQLSYKEQQKRSEVDEINPKTGQPKSKGRQGKNIGNRAPAEFISILERKLGYIGKEVVNLSKEE